MKPMNRWQQYIQTEETLAEGWCMHRIGAASALLGANGISQGIDGRLYVAQAMGAQITAFDLDTTAAQLVVPQGGGMQGCDDCAMLADGSLVTTEPGAGVVGIIDRDGQHRLLATGLPDVNGIAVDAQRRRLFVNEYREGGRLLELDPSGAQPPRVLLDNLDYPNVFSLAADGALYFPQVRRGEVWRYDLVSARATLAFDGLDFPTAVKARPNGCLVAVEAGSGQVTELDPQSGARRCLAQVDPGIDNVVVTADNRIVISHYLHGAITEITRNGARPIAAAGWTGPFDLAVRADGALLVADGFCVAVISGDRIERPIFYGGGRKILPVSIACAGTATFVLELHGELLCYRDLTAPPAVIATANTYGNRLFALDEHAVGMVNRGSNCLVRITAGGDTQVLLSIERPVCACRDERGNLFVVHDDGRALSVYGADNSLTPLADFRAAQGIACSDGVLLVCDAGARAIVSIRLADDARQDVVRDAPIGGVTEQVPIAAFAAVCAAQGDGFYAGFNGDGSIRRLRLQR